jgi:hypothetical protein
MTKGSGVQIEVFNRQQALDYFRRSRYTDCRINAYPTFTDYHGINRTQISFLMIDLDLKDFQKSREILDKILSKVLKKIEEFIGGTPTALWTGNGYHIYQPVSGIILEGYESFYEFTK